MFNIKELVCKSLKKKGKRIKNMGELKGKKEEGTTNLAKSITGGGGDVLSCSWIDFSFAIKNRFQNMQTTTPLCDHTSACQLLQGLRGIQASDSYINCGRKSLINQTDIAQSTVVKPQTKLTSPKRSDLNGKSNEATDKWMSTERCRGHRCETEDRQKGRTGKTTICQRCS